MISDNEIGQLAHDIDQMNIYTTTDLLKDVIVLKLIKMITNRILKSLKFY